VLETRESGGKSGPSSAFDVNTKKSVVVLMRKRKEAVRTLSSLGEEPGRYCLVVGEGGVVDSS